MVAFSCHFDLLKHVYKKIQPSHIVSLKFVPLKSQVSDVSNIVNTLWNIPSDNPVIMLFSSQCNASIMSLDVTGNYVATETTNGYDTIVFHPTSNVKVTMVTVLVTLDLRILAMCKNSKFSIKPSLF